MTKTYVTGKKPCPACRAQGLDKSGNNLLIYSDGGTFCFRCNKRIAKTSFVKGKVVSLKSRCIQEETARKYNFQVGRFTGWMNLKQAEEEGQSDNSLCKVYKRFVY